MNRQVGRAVTRSSLEPVVWASNLEASISKLPLRHIFERSCVDRAQWRGDELRSRDGNSTAYAAARCCWCTAPRSVATKICITSQRQRSAVYIFFTIIAGKLFLYV